MLAGLCIPAASISSGFSSADRGATAADLHLRVGFRTNDRQVTWILTLKNRTNKAVRLAFGTSMYGNVLLRRGGEVVYSWASHKGFLQAIGYWVVQPHERYVRALAPDDFDFDALEPGRYEVDAYLGTVQRINHARRSFTITDG